MSRFVVEKSWFSTLASVLILLLKQFFLILKILGLSSALIFSATYPKMYNMKGECSEGKERVLFRMGLTHITKEVYERDMTFVD